MEKSRGLKGILLLFWCISRYAAAMPDSAFQTAAVFELTSVLMIRRRILMIWIRF